MGVSCKIWIDEPAEGVHVAGGPVVGVVKYYIDKPTSISEATIKFIGRGHVSWSYTEMSDDGIVREIISDDEVYNSSSELMLAPMELQRGSYKYTFKFFIPDDAPPSYEDNFCTIEYAIKVVFKKTNFFSFNQNFTRVIKVVSKMDALRMDARPRSIITGLDNKLFKLFSKRNHMVSLKVELNNTFLTPGEEVKLLLHVTNDSDVDITSIKTQLHCCISYKAEDRIKLREYKIACCEASSPGVPRDGVASISCVVPTKPDLCTINTRVMNRRYVLKVIVQLPMPHADATLDIPVAFAGWRVDKAEEAVEEPPVRVPPPTYWEVMEMRDENN